MITRTSIINKIFETYGFETYLEIGVRNRTENFDLIKSTIKEGVDPMPITPVNYKVTSNEFFKNYVGEKKYDVIFVDGLHTKEQSYIDVINSIKHLNEDGFIVMHDCNPPTEYHIRSHNEYLRRGGEWNGDVFEAFIRLKTELKDWNCFVVDEDFGCGVITKRKLKKQFNPLDNINENITWDYFDENRKNLLDLLSFDEYDKLFE